MTREEIAKRVEALVFANGAEADRVITDMCIAIHNEAIDAAAHKADQRVWRTSGAPIAADIRALKIGGGHG